MQLYIQKAPVWLIARPPARLLAAFWINQLHTRKCTFSGCKKRQRMKVSHENQKDTQTDINLFHFILNGNNSAITFKKKETRGRISFGSLIDNSYASVTVNTPTG